MVPTDPRASVDSIVPTDPEDPLDSIDPKFLVNSNSPKKFRILCTFNTFNRTDCSNEHTPPKQALNRLLGQIPLTVACIDPRKVGGRLSCVY